MIYVILGTTASGKSDLALRLARRFNMPIIGADAFQIYKELEKGSAAMTDEELKGIEHHFIKDHTIKDPVNIARYQKECRKVLDKYLLAGRDVLMCGGSFLYVKAALYSYEFPQMEDDKNLIEELNDLNNDELYERLLKLDEQASLTIHKNNRKRVIRAILNLSNFKKRTISNDRLLYPAVFFALDVDKESNDKRINERTRKMFASGFVEEVKELLKDEQNLTTAFEAIGYKQIKDGLNSGQSEEEMIEIINTKTHQYAKRQRTFLRHQFENINYNSSDKIYEMIERDLEFKSRTRIALKNENYAKIEKENIIVFGAGGVGCSVIESLVRLGVSRITVVDFDEVSASNLNRQIIYNLDDIKKKKTEVVESYVKKINPLINCKTLCLKVDHEFFSTMNDNYSFIFDCIDDVKAKAEIISYAKNNNINLIVSSGTAKKQDSSLLRCGHLSDTGDGLAKALKKELKLRDISYEDIPTVYSYESNKKDKERTLPSLPTVPLAAGLAMVSYFIKFITSTI